MIGFDLHDVAIAFAALVLSVIAFVSATRTARAGREAEEARSEELSHKVDAEAYMRAQVIYDRALAQLRKQNEQQELQMDRLVRRIASLEQALHEAGLALPPT
jgi:hypothetical protein